MTKKDFQYQVRQAYIGHIKWRSAAKAIHLGLPLIEKEVEKDPKKTAFGEWYYGFGQEVNFHQDFKKLEVLNNRIHYIYNNICKISEEKEASTFFKLIKKEDNTQKDNLKLAYFRDLGKQSKELLQTLKQIETEVLSM